MRVETYEGFSGYEDEWETLAKGEGFGNIFSLFKHFRMPAVRLPPVRLPPVRLPPVKLPVKLPPVKLPSVKMAVKLPRLNTSGLSKSFQRLGDGYMQALSAPAELASGVVGGAADLATGLVGGAGSALNALLPGGGGAAPGSGSATGQSDYSDWGIQEQGGGAMEVAAGGEYVVPEGGEYEAMAGFGAFDIGSMMPLLSQIGAPLLGSATQSLTATLQKSLNPAAAKAAAEKQRLATLQRLMGRQAPVMAVRSLPPVMGSGPAPQVPVSAVGGNSVSAAPAAVQGTVQAGGLPAWVLPAAGVAAAGLVAVALLGGRDRGYRR